MGATPQEYASVRRLEKARDLLIGTSLGIAEIALRCGYGDQTSFSRAFRRYFAISPAGVRRPQPWSRRP
jgi:transcriptional regulator GlxA family with amidase domain